MFEKASGERFSIGLAVLSQPHRVVRRRVEDNAPYPELIGFFSAMLDLTDRLKEPTRLRMSLCVVDSGPADFPKAGAFQTCTTY